ncbi:MAG: hypothetical protein ACE5KI_07780, partial [Dehalococcoidia bacterium]
PGAKPKDKLEKGSATVSLSFGLYFFYWTYLTWAQLKNETGGNYYPVWHTLSLFVPIYGLFRFYRHLRVIVDLCKRSGVITNLSPWVCVLMIILGGVLDFIGGSSTSVVVALVMSAISLTLITTLLLWAQSALNAYWAQSKGAGLRETRVRAGEIALGLIGIIGWAGFIVPTQ